MSFKAKKSNILQSLLRILLLPAIVVANTFKSDDTYYPKDDASRFVVYVIYGIVIALNIVAVIFAGRFFL